MKNSSYHNIVLSELKTLFSEKNHIYKQNYRPNFLKNPETGKNLEIDIVIYEKYKKHNASMIGFEIQGEQHFFDIERFGNSSDYTKKNDHLKHELCKKKGIPLIEIFYTDIQSNRTLDEIIKEKFQFLTRKQQKRCFSLLQCFEVQLSPLVDNPIVKKKKTMLYFGERPKNLKNKITSLH